MSETIVADGATAPAVAAAEVDPIWPAGTGYQIFGWILWAVAAGLLWWALASDTTISVSDVDATLSRFDPVKYPPPSAISNLGLMHKQLLIFLAAGITAVCATLLYVAGAAVKAIERHAANGSAGR